MFQKDATILDKTDFEGICMDIKPIPGRNQERFFMGPIPNIQYCFIREYLDSASEHFIALAWKREGVVRT